MGDVTDNFSRHEFGLSRAAAGAYGFAAAPYPEEWVAPRLTVLCAELEKLRAKLGGPKMHVVEAGGYRPRAYDAERIRRGAQGVSPVSQHGEGRAADIRVDGYTPSEVYEVALAMVEAKELRLGGLGVYDRFCHFDVRQDKFRVWDKRSSASSPEHDD